MKDEGFVCANLKLNLDNMQEIIHSYERKTDGSTMKAHELREFIEESDIQLGFLFNKLLT